jgi:phage protein D
MTDAKANTAAARIEISVDGKDWRDISPPLQSLEIEDHDSLTDQAKLVLDDNTGLLANASFEGLLIRIGVGYGEKTPLIFEGVITAARIVTQAEGQKVEITAQDFSFRMSKHTPEERKWEKGQKLSEVVKEIVTSTEGHKPFGITVEDKDVLPQEDVSFSKEKALSQRNQNDWEFLKALADRYMAKVFVEFDGTDKSKLYFVNIPRLASDDPIGELTCCRGSGDLVSFSFEKISSGALKQVTSSTVDFATGKAVTNTPPAPAPRPPIPPPQTDGRDVEANQRKAVEALVELSAAADKEIEPEKKRASGGGSPDPEDSKAKIIEDPTRKLGYRGSGVANGNPKLRAKSRVTITGVSPWAAGDWYLRKVNHKYSRSKVGQKYLATYSTTFEATR